MRRGGLENSFQRFRVLRVVRQTKEPLPRGVLDVPLLMRRSCLGKVHLGPQASTFAAVILIPAPEPRGDPAPSAPRRMPPAARQRR